MKGSIFALLLSFLFGFHATLSFGEKCDENGSSPSHNRTSSRTTTITIPKNTITGTLSIPSEYQELLKYDIRNIALKAEDNSTEDSQALLCYDSEPSNEKESETPQLTESCIVETNIVTYTSNPTLSDHANTSQAMASVTLTTTTICIPCPTVSVTTSTLNPVTITTHWTVTTTIQSQNCSSKGSETIDTRSFYDIQQDPCIDWYPPPFVFPPIVPRDESRYYDHNDHNDVDSSTSNTLITSSRSNNAINSISTTTLTLTSTSLQHVTLTATERVTFTQNVTLTTKAWFPVITTETRHITHVVTTPITVSQILPVTVCSPYPVTLTVNNTITTITTETISSTFPPVVLTETQLSIATVPFPVIQTELHTLPPVVETVTDTVTEYSESPCSTTSFITTDAYYPIIPTYSCSCPSPSPVTTTVCDQTTKNQPTIHTITTIVSTVTAQAPQSIAYPQRPYYPRHRRRGYNPYWPIVPPFPPIPITYPVSSSSICSTETSTTFATTTVVSTTTMIPSVTTTTMTTTTMTTTMVHHHSNTTILTTMTTVSPISTTVIPDEYDEDCIQALVSTTATVSSLPCQNNNIQTTISPTGCFTQGNRIATATIMNGRPCMTMRRKRYARSLGASNGYGYPYYAGYRNQGQGSCSTQYPSNSLAMYYQQYYNWLRNRYASANCRQNGGSIRPIPYPYPPGYPITTGYTTPSCYRHVNDTTTTPSTTINTSADVITITSDQSASILPPSISTISTTPTSIITTLPTSFTNGPGNMTIPNNKISNSSISTLPTKLDPVKPQYPTTLPSNYPITFTTSLHNSSHFYYTNTSCSSECIACDIENLNAKNCSCNNPIVVSTNDACNPIYNKKYCTTQSLALKPSTASCKRTITTTKERTCIITPTTTSTSYTTITKNWRCCLSKLLRNCTNGATCTNTVTFMSTVLPGLPPTNYPIPSGVMIVPEPTASSCSKKPQLYPIPPAMQFSTLGICPSRTIPSMTTPSPIVSIQTIVQPVTDESSEEEPQMTTSTVYAAAGPAYMLNPVISSLVSSPLGYSSVYPSSRAISSSSSSSSSSSLGKVSYTTITTAVTMIPSSSSIVATYTSTLLPATTITTVTSSVSTTEITMTMTA